MSINKPGASSEVNAPNSSLKQWLLTGLAGIGIMVGGCGLRPVYTTECNPGQCVAVSKDSNGIKIQTKTICPKNPETKMIIQESPSGRAVFDDPYAVVATGGTSFPTTGEHPEYNKGQAKHTLQDGEQATCF